MTGSVDILPIAPRGLRREASASYVGVRPTKFDQWVKDKRMPQPKRVDGCVIWDRRKLDQAFDELDSDGDTSGDEWEGAEA